MNFKKIANGKLYDVSSVNYKVSIICNFIKICKVIKLYEFIKNFELTKIYKVLKNFSTKNSQDYLGSSHHNIILNFFYLISTFYKVSKPRCSTKIFVPNKIKITPPATWALSFKAMPKNFPI